jgi:aminomethyltransferase
MHTLQETPLHGRHVALGARMVAFAGYDMPVQYEGVIPEHRAVRERCGVFDVSHMGELMVEGPTAAELLQQTLSNDLSRLGDWDAQYSLLTNDRGGIVDDVIVYRLSPFRFLVVVNAANKDTAFRWLKERELRGSEVTDHSGDFGLLAVQGPASLRLLGLEPARSFTFAEGELFGIDCMINRTGYTGEVGVELLAMAEDVGELWDRVLDAGAVPCGLGARDTLRLEVCYPLHGNDITEETDPISAGLAFAVALDKDFTGSEPIRRVAQAGPERRLVPFVMTEKAVPRHGMAIAEGGEVTSGTHSPMLDVGIGLGYVPSALAEPGSAITIDVRGKPRRARVGRKPLYKREESD